jgi:hypothetical protein
MMVRLALFTVALLAIALLSLNVEAVLRAFHGSLMALLMLAIAAGMFLLGVSKAINAIRLHIIAFRSRKG